MVWLFFGFFLLLRGIFWLITFPNPDEAYYWLWGQHPALSYYDHPPLEAWVQGIFTTLFGRSNLVLRLPNLISNGIFFYTYYRIVRYLYGKQAQIHFGILVMLILASPLYFLFLALAWHDHLLILFSLISGYQFIRFLDSYLADGKGEGWRLYGAAIALGFAGLCKYNAVFVAAGFGATLIADRRLRPLWRDYRIYLAMAIATSALIPIVLWNVSNDFQSFHYYVNRSVNTGSLSFRIGSLITFVLISFLVLSPVNSICFLRQLKRGDRLFQEKTVYPIVAFWVFVISTVTLMVISLLSAALYYWNITAYLLLFPLATSVFVKEDVTVKEGGRREEGKFFSIRSLSFIPHLSCLTRKRLFISGQLLGLLFAVLLVIHYGVLPVSALISPTDDPDSRMLFGWQQVATGVKQESNDLSNPFLVTSDYRSASALAYQLDDASVMAISDRVDQFDFWYTSDRPFKARDAVILSDDWHPILPEVLAQFERTSPPSTIAVKRFGVWIKNYYVTKAYRFKGGRVS